MDEKAGEGGRVEPADSGRSEPADEALDPTDAFELLGNETRLAIIRELSTRRRTNWRREGLGFADLRKAVGVRDAGTFSYHLDALRDRFVEKRDDEYVLSTTGLMVADAVLAGTYGDPGESVTATTDHRCPACDRALVASLDTGRVSLACEAHGEHLSTSLPPAAVADRDLDEVLAIAGRDVGQEMERAIAGVCFHCWGRMASSLETEAPFENPATGEPIDAKPEVPEEWGALAVFGCECCETVFWTVPAGCVLRHPAVVSFAHDHGVDVLGSLPIKQVGWTVEGSFESREPIRYRLGYEFEGDELGLVLDGDAEVVAVRE